MYREAREELRRRPAMHQDRSVASGQGAFGVTADERLAVLYVRTNPSSLGNQGGSCLVHRLYHTGSLPFLKCATSYHLTFIEAARAK